MAQKPKILAFAGSLRNQSNNKKLLKIAIEGAKAAGAEVTFIDLKDYPMPIYDQDIEDAEGPPENAKKLKELMLSHQGFLIASPEYNSSISAVLKNLIDWASRKAFTDEPDLACFKNKTAALMSVSPSFMGGMRGLVTLRSILDNIGVLVMPQQQTIPNGFQAFNEQGNLINGAHQKNVEQLGAALANLLSKLNT